MSTENRIPRVIHYCWFGGNPLPELAVRCIESWKKFCPGYEIVRWDESNYDVRTCVYTKEAYEAKKWAFVSDYARFDILYQHGGLYFDTDVELIAPIEDILQQGAFFGIEQGGNNDMVAPGLGMAAPAGMTFYQTILEAYRGWHFRNPDGTNNQTTVVQYTTELLRRNGFHNCSEICCVNDIWIYPWEYFCPMKYETGVMSITENTRSIHHYSASWLTDKELACYRFTTKASRIFGVTLGKKLGRLYAMPYRLRKQISQKGFWGAVKLACRKIRKK